MSQHIWIRFRIWIGIPHHFRLYKKTLDVGIDGGAQSCPLCGHSLMFFLFYRCIVNKSVATAKRSWQALFDSRVIPLERPVAVDANQLNTECVESTTFAHCSGCKPPAPHAHVIRLATPRPPRLRQHVRPQSTKLSVVSIRH